MGKQDFQTTAVEYGKGQNYIAAAYMQGVEDAFKWHSYSPKYIGHYFIRVKAKREHPCQVKEFDYYAAILNHDKQWEDINNMQIIDTENKEVEWRWLDYEKSFY